MIRRYLVWLGDSGAALVAVELLCNRVMNDGSSAAALRVCRRSTVSIGA